jgi:hypothetical protein
MGEVVVVVAWGLAEERATQLYVGIEEYGSASLLLYQSVKSTTSNVPVDSRSTVH